MTRKMHEERSSTRDNGKKKITRGRWSILPHARLSSVCSICSIVIAVAVRVLIQRVGTSSVRSMTQTKEEHEAWLWRSMMDRKEMTGGNHASRVNGREGCYVDEQGSQYDWLRRKELGRRARHEIRETETEIRAMKSASVSDPE